MEEEILLKKPKYMWKFNIRSSILSKAKPYTIYLYSDYLMISCIQVHMDADEAIEKAGNITLEYDQIKGVYNYKYKNKDYIRIDTYYHYSKKAFFLIPTDKSQYNDDEVKSKLSSLLEEYTLQKKNAAIARQESIQQRLEAEEAERKNSELFFKATYDFHIHENTPKYIFDSKDNYTSLIYLNENNDINFLTIDGNTQQEVNGIILYDSVHYYEKAGNIHYVSDINVDYQSSGSFGGSFRAGSINIGAAMLGGLLFGPMGMAVGAMASHKPAEYKPPEYKPEKFNIQSSVHRIDERSVILNYYSGEHKQFMDIELPADIYNFFQTYLPKKKYDVVIELEKANATQFESSEKGITSVKQRLQNLKELYSEELITESEYNKRKAEILNEI